MDPNAGPSLWLRKAWKGHPQKRTNFRGTCHRQWSCKQTLTNVCRLQHAMCASHDHFRLSVNWKHNMSALIMAGSTPKLIWKRQKNHLKPMKEARLAGRKGRRLLERRVQLPAKGAGWRSGKGRGTRGGNQTKMEIPMSPQSPSIQWVCIHAVPFSVKFGSSALRLFN